MYQLVVKTEKGEEVFECETINIDGARDTGMKCGHAQINMHGDLIISIGLPFRIVRALRPGQWIEYAERKKI